MMTVNRLQQTGYVWINLPREALLSGIERSSLCDPLPEWGRSIISNGNFHHISSTEQAGKWACLGKLMVNVHWKFYFCFILAERHNNCSFQGLIFCIWIILHYSTSQQTVDSPLAAHNAKTVGTRVLPHQGPRIAMWDSKNRSEKNSVFSIKCVLKANERWMHCLWLTAIIRLLFRACYPLDAKG